MAGRGGAHLAFAVTKTHQHVSLGSPDANLFERLYSNGLGDSRFVSHSGTSDRSEDPGTAPSARPPQNPERCLLPEGPDDGLAVLAQHEVEPVHVVSDSGHALLRRDDPEV